MIVQPIFVEFMMDLFEITVDETDMNRQTHVLEL